MKILNSTANVMLSLHVYMFQIFRINIPLLLCDIFVQIVNFSI